MKLPNSFSTFKDKNILLFVSGKQEAVLYHLYDSRVNPVFHIKVPRPKYSDNEGKFRTSRGGRRIAGNVEIRRDEIVIREFIKELNKRIKEKNLKFKEIYLFAPDMSKNWIKDSLPKTWQKKITKTKEGNYTKLSVDKILEKIQKEEKPKFLPKTVEEKKIISVPKTKQKKGRRT